MKYLRLLFGVTKGYRKKYLLAFLFQFIAVVFMVLATFTTKILIDTLSGDIFKPVLNDPLTNLVITIYGGREFLSNNIYFFAIILFMLTLARASINIARILIRAACEVSIKKDLRMKLFTHMERLPYEYLKKHKSGDIIQTCTRDIDEICRFMVRQVYLIMYTFDMMILSFIVLVFINWQIALISLAILPTLFIYSLLLIKKVRTKYRITDDSESNLTAKIQENLNAVRVVKAYNNERFEIDDFEKYLHDYKHKYISFRLWSSFFYSSSDIFVFGQIALTILYGVYLVFTNSIGIGTLMAAYTYTSMIVWPLRDVATVVADFAKTVASLDRINLIMNEPIEDLTSGDTPLIKGDICFENVGFKYGDGIEPVLKNINLNIKAGETIAIMGKTGSGKSTLANLLCRLYDPSEGHILLNGNDITCINRSYLRRHISIVLQEPFLFSKTIINNLRIAKHDASDEEIYDAASVASIHDSIVKFKNRYDTLVGEKGVTLSGGQKQRVAMARTIINKAPIIIFDDSLSAVDTETDIKIRTALRNRTNQSTTLIITHRIATAKDADKIVVLDNGTISECGKHEDLIKNQGLYRRIYEIQSRMN